jgi:hypothetical protein
MPVDKRLTALAALAACVAAVLSPWASSAVAAGEATGAPAKPTREKPLSVHALLTSRELWATIDVCSPADQPHTVGVRGSMPGNGVAHDKMFMSFRLQYMDPTTKRWVDLSGAAPTFVTVGGGGAARQDGQSFQLVPGKSPATLRGVLDFQWRRGGTVLTSAARPTTAGRKSLAGADPKGYSAATCAIS